MDYTGIFTYNTNNLLISTPDFFSGITVAVVFLVGIILLHYVSIYSIGFLWLRQDGDAISKKKKVLADLIIMKDIQTELEKEIEQATLKAAFQDE